MRLKAEIWVKAYVRRCAVEGVAAVVVRHGDDDAGAIFIRINRLDGTSLLFGPARRGLTAPSTIAGGWRTSPMPGAPDEKVDAAGAGVRFRPGICGLSKSKTALLDLEDWMAPVH